MSRDAEVALSINDLTKGSAESFRLYMLVPYTLPQLDIPSTANSDDGIDIVTDMWIEKCLYSNSFVPPEANITSTPIFKFPLPG